jgi:tetratricopeptide (TPR) repeat protein
MHRSRSEGLRAATCADARTRTGKAFLAATRALRGASLDACAAQPVTEVAAREVWIGAGAPAPQDPEAAAERLYVHGLGLLHEVQEHVGRAGRSFEAALARTRRPGLRAQVLAGLAAVASRQGRVDDAVRLAREAAALAPEHPAPTWLEGQALAAVWRWSGATGPLQAVAAAAPDDPLVWSEVALAHGSVGASADALAAAGAGLAFAPRQADLLRIQALALADLAAGSPEATAAMAAYLEHRPPDGAPRVRSACSREVPGCARERVPVHTHALRWR